MVGNMIPTSCDGLLRLPVRVVRVEAARVTGVAWGRVAGLGLDS